MARTTITVAGRRSRSQDGIDPAPLTGTPYEAFTRRVLDLHRTVVRYHPDRLCTCGQAEDACVYLALARDILGYHRPGDQLPLRYPLV